MPAHVPVTVVVASRDRRDRVLDVVGRLRSLPEQPPVVVVDDGSSDGTAQAVRDAHPDVVVHRFGVNRGVAAARNAGVRAAQTPYVAFADDDSWWAPGALTTVADRFDAHPRLGLIAARVLVGPAERLDPTCQAMADSPLPADGLPGPRVLGFIACGAAVRRTAFEAAGGFPERYVIGGEEEPLALAMAAGGWDLVHLPEVVAHHHPGPRTPAQSHRRRVQVARNDLWTAWRLRPAGSALRRSGAILCGLPLRARPAVLASAVRGGWWVVADRRPVTPSVEQQRRLLDTDR